MKVRDILTKHQLFSQLSEKTIAFLEKEAKIITFEPKEVLIPPGRKGNYFGIVIEGQLEALDMKEERLGLINKGEYLGEMSLLTGEPSTVGVRSVTPSQVLLVPHNVMARILPESPQMIKQLSSTMRVRLVKREDSVEEQEALHIARGSLPGPGDLLSSLGRAKKILVSIVAIILLNGIFSILHPLALFLMEKSIASVNKVLFTSFQQDLPVRSKSKKPWQKQITPLLSKTF